MRASFLVIIILAAGSIFPDAMTTVKMKIAVLNLKNANGVTTADAELISDRLRNEFFSTGTVDVMEREQMQEILKEQGFQTSGTTCTDEGCIVAMGKLLGVRRIIIGSVGKLGSMYMINIRGINVESGKVEKVVSEDVKGDIDKLVEILPRIAGVFTGTVIVNIQNPPQSKEVSRPTPKAVESQPLQGTSLIHVPCDRDTIFLERLIFQQSQVGVSLKDFDFDNLNEELADAINEAIDKEIVVIPREQLAKVHCNGQVIRIFVKSYSTEKDGSQRKGTLKVIVSLYNTPRSSEPLSSVVFEETGSRDWSEAKTLMYAFEAIRDEIEDDLDSDFDRFLK
jgi:TolB-like protein